MNEIKYPSIYSYINHLSSHLSIIHASSAVVTLTSQFPLQQTAMVLSLSVRATSLNWPFALQKPKVRWTQRPCRLQPQKKIQVVLNVHRIFPTTVFSTECWTSGRSMDPARICYSVIIMMMIIIIIIIIRKTLVWTCSNISRNKSSRQGNHIVESTSTNWKNYPQQQTRHYSPW